MENHHEGNRSCAADRGDRGLQCGGIRIPGHERGWRLHLRTVPGAVPDGLLLRVIAA